MTASTGSDDEWADLARELNDEKSQPASDESAWEDTPGTAEDAATDADTESSEFGDGIEIATLSRRAANRVRFQVRGHTANGYRGMFAEGEQRLIERCLPIAEVAAEGDISPYSDNWSFPIHR